MTEAVPKKKAAKKKAAPSGAAPSKPASQRDVVKCKNISNRIINTTKSSMKPGDSGKCTVAELRQLGKFLEKE